VGNNYKTSIEEIKLSDVNDYEFETFETENRLNKNGTEVKSYNFSNLNSKIDKSRKIKEQNSIKKERYQASSQNFSISPIVKEHRGMIAQAKKEREKKVSDEVDRKFSKIKEDGFKSGFDKGYEKGRKEVIEQTKAESNEKIELLTEMLETALLNERRLLEGQREEIYGLIKNLTKWVILRELKDDNDYLNRLMEKLIVEIGSSSNLHIQVNKNLFKKMPEVLESVEKKMGEIKNVRVEVDYDLGDVGFNIESKNLIIKGSLEDQFNTLDKLFESVGDNGGESHP